MSDEKETLNVIEEEEEEEPVADVESEAEEESEAEDSDVASEAEASEAEESEAEEEEAVSEAEEEANEPEEDEDGNPIGVSGVEGDGNPLSKKTRARKGKVVVSNISGIAELAATKNTKITNASFEEESDEGEEEEEDEHYLQKFDSEMRDNFILNYHPEARTHNYEEVKALARVTRDGRGIIIDPMHKTLPFLTKYEMTRVLGQRAKQLDSGAKAFVKIPLNVIDGYHIAKLELEQKKIPFIIKRPFPNGGIEYWHVYDLELL
jgi:DNA-directed RNA polymerase subunit K/omega